jgi:hypothetical protein
MFCYIPPSSRGLFDAADIQDAIVQMVENLLVRFPPQKSTVSVHAVPCKKCDASLGNMLLDVSQETVGGLLGGHG